MLKNYDTKFLTSVILDTSKPNKGLLSMAAMSYNKQNN